VLGSVLEDPAFRKERRRASLLHRARLSFYRFLGRLFERARGLVASNLALVKAGILVLIGLAVAFVVYGIVTLLRRPPRRADLPAPVEGVDADRPADEGALLFRADGEASAGRFVRALRLLEHAAIVILRKRGELPARPGLTDLEGVRVLRERRAGEATELFARIAELHDRAVYGGFPPGPAVVEEARAAATRLAALPERSVP